MSIYDQMVLRRDYESREFIHSAVLKVADQIRNESPTVEHHVARAAMATKIIETDDPMVRDFVSRILFRAIMDDGIRNSMVKDGRVMLFNANEPAILQGVADLWNETTMAVWPTVIEDTTPQP